MRRQNFQYMKYPPELYSITPKSIFKGYVVSQAFTTDSKGNKIRRLFNRVPYTQEQNQKIQEFKKFAMDHNKSLNCSDKQILRYLYSNNFVFKDTLQKINVFLDWIHDPSIQILNNHARLILNQGAIFTYGRDKLSRPIIYMDLTKIKLQRYDLKEYYSAYNALMTVVLQQCFVPGLIQTYTFIIDMGGKNFGLSFQALGKIIQKLSIVYSMYLGQLIAVNTQNFVKFTYQGIKLFIHEETRKKITILHVNQLQKLSQYIDKSQLYARYKGQNPDPYEYWPPGVPGLKIPKNFDQQSIYYSVGQNESFFLQKYNQRLGETQPSCCEQCEGFNCQIF